MQVIWESDMKAVRLVGVFLVVLWSTGSVSWSGADAQHLSFPLYSSPSLDAADAQCEGQLQKIGPCLEISNKNCSAAELMLQPCWTWVLSQPSGIQPPPDCCLGMQKTERQFPTCFCLIAFYPPSAFNRSLQAQAPKLCNITTDLCQQCPPLLMALPSGESNPVCVSMHAGKTKPHFTRMKILALTLSISGGLIVGAVIICALAVWKKNHASSPQLLQEQEEIARIEGRPNIFPYNVLRIATRNFHLDNKVGEGGFGEVFKGVLPDGSEVAVKRLVSRSRQGKNEFLNEVTLITGVQHRNLVKLKGCCLKGDERLLVYEFLENKSLYQALFDPRYPIYLDWPSRLKIAIGTARGLAYLHEGCQMRIIHRDVKASNILLDRNLEPKISDFGLAKLIQNTHSHISTRVAGTVGYLSPEYALRGQLTEKADVFSYGIVLLELLSGRTNLDLRLTSDLAYLLDWIWQLYEEDRLMDILDPRLKKAGGFQEEIHKVAEVALLCTQSATMRPTMSRVLSMLSGDTEVTIPQLIKPPVRHFRGSRDNPGSYRSANRKRETPEAMYIFKSSSGSSSNYVSEIEPR